MAQDGPSERMDMSNLEAEGLDTAALTESDGYEPASPIKTPDFPPTLAEGDFLDDIVPETFVEGDFLDDLVPETPVSPTVMRGDTLNYLRSGMIGPQGFLEEGSGMVTVSL